MRRPEFPASRLREMLNYAPETGVFTWRVQASKNVKVGDVTGCDSGKGYGHMVIGLFGKRYAVHRLAWLYMTGEWPRFNIDHIDGDPTNNRFANLRDVPHVVNIQNQRRPFKGKDIPLLGVHAAGKRFIAKIGANGRQHYLGTFDTPEHAHAAYVSAKRQLHPGGML